MPKSELIEIEHHKRVAARELSALQSELTKLTPNIKITQQESGSWSAWEWILPAVIILYMSKGILDGFLAEIGAGAASGLKSALTKVFKKAQKANIRWTTPDEATAVFRQRNKLTVAEFKERWGSIGKPAAVMSITFEIAELHTRKACTVRFVFPYQLNKPLLTEALNTIPNALEDAQQIAKAVVKLDKQINSLIKTDERKALELSLSKEFNHRWLEQVFAFDPERGEWIDVHAEEDKASKRPPKEIRNALKRRKNKQQ